ncbi:hypothetical protein V6O07_23220 [Arthrospira platensis SPKY2]
MNKDKIKLILVKVNPFTISVAIEAYLKGIRNITFFDKEPLKYWQYPYIDLNKMMDTPVSMDLVSKNSLGRDYSLFRFINLNDKFPLSQSSIEKTKLRVSNKEFEHYLENSIESLKGYGIPFIEKEVKTIEKSYIKLEDDSSTIFTHCVLGYENYEEIFPNTLKFLNIGDKRINHSVFNDITPELKLKIGVIGTSNNILNFSNKLSELNINNTIFFTKHYNTRNYELPSFEEWGLKSCYNDYYKTIPSSHFKRRYIEKIKQYPVGLKKELVKKMQIYLSNKKVNLLELNLINNMNLLENINKNDFLFLDLEKEYDISSIPINIRLDKSEVFIKLPKLLPSYNSVNNLNIFFVGPFSMDQGGYYQCTLNSTGSTSKSIIEEMIK